MSKKSLPRTKGQASTGATRPAARAAAGVKAAKKKPAKAEKPAAKSAAKPRPTAKAPLKAAPATAAKPASKTPPRGAKPPARGAKPPLAKPTVAKGAKPALAKPTLAKPALAKPTLAKPAPGKAARPPLTKPAPGKPPVAKAPVGKGAKPVATAPAKPDPTAKAGVKGGPPGTQPVAAPAKTPPAARSGAAKPIAAAAAKPAQPAPGAAASKAVKARPTIVPPKPAVKIPPEQALLEKAQRALSTGDEEQAVRIYEKMTVDFPDDPRGRIELARVKRRRGDDKGALEEYAKILRKAPSEPMALWYKAEVFLAQKPEPDFTQAVACYKKIVQAHGRKKDDLSKKVVDQAKKQLRFCEARKLSLQGRRYLTSQDQKQIKKGREILEKALSVYPEDARNHMNLGVAYLLLGDADKASELCRAAIHLNPSYARAHLMLGRALQKQRQLRLAKDAFLKCIELDRSGRDAQDAWNFRREVERDIAKVRLMLFHALSGRPGADGELVRLTLGQMKQMVSMLEGDAVDGADLTLDARGHYTLTAYSERHRYRFYPGPESLVVEHDGLTAV